jgi:hypothetical protein
VPGAARHEDVRPWARRDLLLANGEGELAVEHEEGLLHSAVNVRHRPGSSTAGELGEGEGMVGGGLTGASTRIWMMPRLMVRPSPGATVCACPDSSIVPTPPCGLPGPSGAKDPPDDTVLGARAGGNIKK